MLSNMDRLIQSNVELASNNSALEAGLADATADLQDVFEQTSLFDAELQSAQASFKGIKGICRDH